jgi:bacillithiol system protein YtxJ
MSLFSFGKKSVPKNKINWIQLTSEDELDNIILSSTEKPILFFKHSTRCSISAMALHGLEQAWDFTTDDITAYYLDLIAYRPVSNAIAEKTGVVHQSPQAIVMQNNTVVYTASHNGIKVASIHKAIAE